jgi:hypothetical protein
VLLLLKEGDKVFGAGHNRQGEGGVGGGGLNTAARDTGR